MRISKPRLVVETGIHDGLGSAVLLRALERNAAEGYPGHLMSFDTNPTAGWLVPDSLRQLWTPVTGDTKQTLELSLAGKLLDVFVHDSDHALDHERWELQTACRFAAPGAVLISDNSHVSPVLRELADTWGASYHYFHEQPMNHFYAGCGIGLATDLPLEAGV